MNYGFNDDKEQVEVLSKAEAKIHSDVTHTIYQYNVGNIDTDETVTVDINFAQFLALGQQVTGVLGMGVYTGSTNSSPQIDTNNYIKVLAIEPVTDGIIRYHLKNTFGLIQKVVLKFTLATTEKVTTSE